MARTSLTAARGNDPPTAGNPNRTVKTGEYKKHPEIAKRTVMLCSRHPPARDRRTPAVRRRTSRLANAHLDSGEATVKVRGLCQTGCPDLGLDWTHPLREKS